MAGIRVQLDADGVARLTGDLAERVIADVTEQVYDDARRIVPVDEGDLRESLDWSAEGERGVVSVGTDHWEFVEYGTRYMDAQPYMRPALYRRRVVKL